MGAQPPVYMENTPLARLHTIPHDQSLQYEEGHDDGMRTAIEAVIGSVPESEVHKEIAHQVASCPMRFGWSDALPMFSARFTTENLSRQPEGCLAQLESESSRPQCPSRLTNCGHVGGLFHHTPHSSEPGEWQRLAIPRVFFFRPPLQGDRGVVSGVPQSKPTKGPTSGPSRFWQAGFRCALALSLPSTSPCGR